MKNTYVIGDIHGRHEVVEKMLSYASDDTRIVFVGDYLDSYKRSTDECKMSLCMVNEAIKDGMNVVGLLGNHEYSYIHPDFMKCSNYDYELQPFMNDFMKNHSKLQDHFWMGDILVTHAGVTGLWKPYYQLDTDQEVVDKILNTDDRYNIGYSRGGYMAFGGIFWCDWRRDFEPLETVPQIVGHTRTRSFSPGGIQQKGNSYCIDCLDDLGSEYAQVLLVKDEDINKSESVRFADL